MAKIEMLGMFVLIEVSQDEERNHIKRQQIQMGRTLCEEQSLDTETNELRVRYGVHVHQ